jgi:basic amino acid/polyamine antiporter, APA family
VGAPAASGETRELGLTMCIALIVGNTIGIGIFMMPAALAPYGLNALSAWVITAVGCLMVAWVFAGLARSFPADDGPYAYASRAFGDGVAFATLWCYWVSTWLTNAAIAIGVTGYLSTFFPVLNEQRGLSGVTALSLLWLFVLINARGVRTAGWVQVGSTLLKLLPMIAVVVLGVWELVLSPHAGAALTVPPTPASMSALISASTIALFAMLGVECAAIPAGRVRDPERTIPRATFAGTLIVALIYMSISVVPILLVPQKELADSSAPFADLFARFMGAGSGKLLAAFVIVSGLGALNGWTLILGELTRSFANHGGFPRGLGKVNRHGSPTRAFVLTGIAASVVLLMNYDESTAAGFTFLSVVVTAANLPLYFVCALAVLVLWRRGEIARPGPREWRWFAAAALAAVYCAWVSIGIGGKSLLWALALGAAGLPVYWWYAVRPGRRSATATQSGT